MPYDPAMTRALVLFAQPCPESFAAAQHSVVVDALTARGWEVDDCDLYAEGFDPVMSAEGRRLYHDVTRNIEPVRDYVERLLAAQALILVHPVWNYGMPAIMKGFFDRVFLPGVAFRLEDGILRPNLTHLTHLACVTSYGGSRFRTFLAGDPPRKFVSRSLRGLCGGRVRFRYLALHSMDLVTAEDRAAHLEKVRIAMATF